MDKEIRGGKIMENKNIILYRYVRKHGRITAAEAAKMFFVRLGSVRRIFMDAEIAYPDDIIRTRNCLVWVVR
jgi:hypothetical protein